MTDAAPNRAPAGALDFQVRRDDLRTTRFAPLDAIEDAPLADGEVLASVDAFAFTANNVTYAVFGDGMHYWDFFPAPDGWGRVPVWGFGTVRRSAAPGVEPGERLYGYFPMSSWLRLQPARISAGGFSDASEHRAHLHPVYNRYQRVAADPAHDPDREPAQMLLRPLFTTSFLIDDFLADAGFFGAGQVLITSASSKTSIGLAHQLHRLRSDAVRVTGLTSASNRSFCEALGSYDAVLAYDDLEQLDAGVATVAVDMAGNAGVLRRIHAHFADALKHSALVGGTHWDARSGADGEGPLPGPEPALFFAPAQIARRVQEWGNDGYDARLADAWNHFVVATDGWMKVQEAHGAAAVERVYLETLNGGLDPALGNILALDA